LKTIDQYYYGANNSIAHANVNSIISANILSLLDDQNRKFSYVEQAFFQRWVEEQSDEKLEQVRQLVASGQLEFINGGYSMHDEACPTFIDMLDNTHIGNRAIYEQFGVTPKTTWQIVSNLYFLLILTRSFFFILLIS
jgi:alpha-mannosidase